MTDVVTSIAASMTDEVINSLGRLVQAVLFLTIQLRRNPTISFSVTGMPLRDVTDANHAAAK